MKRHLFSVTLKDCEVNTFCSGGPGGQHQNKVATGVRIIHKASGSIGESREYRTQIENKKAAFTRMANTKAFKVWAKVSGLKLLGQKTPEELVDEAMSRKQDIKTEVKDINGKWTVEAKGVTDV